MSERVISDPSVAGWELDANTGYWMWAAGGSGGGGSIQDGDTEGQITTWDGTEWTPESALSIAADGSVVFQKSDGSNALTIDTFGTVRITGKLFINGEEVTAGGGSSLWTDNGDGSISFAGTAKATDFIAE